MQERQDTITQIFEFFARSGMWIVSVLIGIMAKISNEILNGRKLSIWQWLGIVGVSIFFGYMAHQYCESNAMNSSEGYVVPIATLFGGRIMVYITRNFKSIAARIFGLDNNPPQTFPRSSGNPLLAKYGCTSRTDCDKIHCAFFAASRCFSFVRSSGKIL